MRGGLLTRVLSRRLPLSGPDDLAKILDQLRGDSFTRAMRACRDLLNERVLLRYSAFPYQKFGEYPGTVVTVSDAALTPEEVQSLLSGAQPTKQTSTFYRVIVKPDTQFVTVYGEERKLPASMQVQAYALLDRRPLYQWILEPLYDIGRAAHIVEGSYETF